MKETDAQEIRVIQRAARSIVMIHNESVILDSDLADIYGVETRRLNEQVRRNPDRFPEDFAFQLTKDEFDHLKSQIATSSSDWGGKRKLPLVYTEHGALMAANVLRTRKANAMSVYVVRAFVQMRDVLIAQKESSRAMPVAQGQKALPARRHPTTLNKKMSSFLNTIGPKIQTALEQVLDSVVDQSRGTTVRQEAQDLIEESIQYLKSKLSKAGLENQEIAARVTKLLAEAEKEREAARKKRAETDHLEFINMVRKLRLVLEANKTLALGTLHPTNPEIVQIDAFLSALKELTTE